MSLLCPETNPMESIEVIERKELDLLTVLMADDDADDCLLVKDAFKESRLPSDLRCVEDGEALLEYLYRRGKYSDSSLAPHPALILLDLNMPRKDGREALREIKSDPELRDIPVVVLTTSMNKADMDFSYGLGASSFITKPDTFEGLVNAISSLSRYWTS